jgi:hypothetical protein
MLLFRHDPTGLFIVGKNRGDSVGLIDLINETLKLVKQDLSWKWRMVVTLDFIKVFELEARHAVNSSPDEELSLFDSEFENTLPDGL